MLQFINVVFQNRRQLTHKMSISDCCTPSHMFYTKNYEKMISVPLNFINMFTKYVYLKYELTLTHNIQQ